MKNSKTLAQLTNDIKSTQEKLNKIPKKARTIEAQQKHNAKRNKMQAKKKQLENELKVKSIKTLQRAAKKSLKIPVKKVTRQQIERNLLRQAEIENISYVANMMGEKVNKSKLDQMLSESESSNNNNTKKAKNIVRRLAVEGQLLAKAQKDSFERKHSKSVQEVSPMILLERNQTGVRKFKPKGEQQRKIKTTKSPPMVKRFGKKGKDPLDKPSESSEPVFEIIPVLGTQKGDKLVVRKNNLFVEKQQKKRGRKKMVMCKTCKIPMHPVTYQGSVAEKASSKYMCCTGGGDFGLKKERKGCGACDFNRIFNSNSESN